MRFQPPTWFATACVGLAWLAFLPIGTAHTDGRLIAAALQFGRIDFAWDWAMANGRPLLYLGPWVAAAASPEFATAASNVVLIALAAWLAGSAARELGASPDQAAVVSLFCGLNPALSMVVYVTSFQFQIGYAAMMGCAWMLFRSLRPGKESAAHAAAAGCAAAVSSVAAEATTFVIMVLPLLWVVAHRVTTLRGLLSAARYAVWAPLMAGSCFIAYFLAFPALGYFAAERSVGASAAGFALAAATHVIALSVLAAPMLAVAAAGGSLLNAGEQPASREPRSSRLAVLCAGLVVVGMLPYLLAGRQAAFGGWHVRQTLLAFACCAVPFALWLGAIAGRHGPARTRVILALLGVALMGNLLARLPGLAERTLKHDAFMGALAAAPVAQPGAVYCVDDHLDVAGRYINQAEWTAMAQQATGRSDVVAVRVPGSAPAAAVADEIESLRDPLRTYYWTRPSASQNGCTHWVTIPEPGHRLFWSLAITRNWATRVWAARPATWRRALEALPVIVSPAPSSRAPQNPTS